MAYEECSAIVIERPREARLKKIKLTPRQADSVIARTTFSAISSGTDMKTWRGEQHHTACWYPLVPGYENVGVVVEEGSWAPGFKKGDRVMINEVRQFAEVCAAWGGNTHVAVKDKSTAGGNDNLAKIPDQVSDAEAVMAYLACVSHKGVLKAPIKDGDTVLVTGAGLIGLSAIQIVKILYPKCRVVCIERHPFRAEIARKIADQVILADGKEAAAFNEATQGKRADVILECSGNAAVPGTLHAFLRDGGWSPDSKGGHIHLQGDYPERVSFDIYHKWFTKNCTISMTCALYGSSKETVLQWVASGKLRFKDIPVETWPAGKCAEAYPYFDKKNGEVFKILFDWRDV